MIAAGARSALELARTYARQLDESVLLYAGANHASPRVRDALSAEIGGMPAMGRPYSKQQPGTSAISALEQLVEGQLCALFRAKWSEARLPNATTANLALYAAFCGPQRPLMSTSREHGGHPSCLAGGTPSLLGLDVIEIPSDENAAVALLERARPGLLLLGTALVLRVDFPGRLIKRARELGVVVAYDASHVAGLIAGGKVRNPFDAGVQIVTASTYKSFGGPPGGVIVGSDSSHEDLLRQIVCPKMTSNYDAARVLAISLACSDAAEFMPAYAEAMMAAADELHRALVDRGLQLAPRGGEGRTHQLFVEFDSEATAMAAMRALEQCNVLAGVSGSGLRLGTQAIARKSYGPPSLERLADLMATIVRDGPSGQLKTAVNELALEHRELAFCR